MYVKNGHKTGVQEDNVKIRKEKYIRSLLHPSKTIYTPPIKKMSYTNSPPKYKTTLIQNYSPFLSRMTKGKSLRGCHLVITRRASIVLIITNIIILISRGLWRRRWRGSATTMARLSTGNVIDSGVYLTHLIGEIVKTSTKISLHPLKLRHDGLQGHTSC